MTCLIASMTVERMTGLESRVFKAWSAGADAIELRLDQWEDDPRVLQDFLNGHRDRRWIVTCRSREEGGRYPGTLSDRVSLLIAVARGTGVVVDFEFADWGRSANIRQKIHLACEDHGATAVVPSWDRKPDRRLILSWHAMKFDLDEARRVLAWIQCEEGVLAKAVLPVHQAHELLDLLDLMRESGDRAIVLGLGGGGQGSRLLAKKLGTWGSYASCSEYETTAPGQIPVRAMVESYRWRSISPLTRVFGVVGNPIDHSLSPVLMNHWFETHGVDGLYLRFPVPGQAEDLHRFLEGLRLRPWLDVAGLSITLPHKESAYRWAGHRCERMAHSAGAINTLMFSNGGVEGFNTDIRAVVETLVEAFDGDRKSLAGLAVDVLGAGGIARGVCAALHELGSAVTVFGRSIHSAQVVADLAGGKARPWEERISVRGRVLVNCTSVGMVPDVDQSPMPMELLAGRDLVFDLVYRPVNTKLLRDARTQGVRTANGLTMFVRQASAQFALWTGICPDLADGLRFLEHREEVGSADP